MPVRERNVSMRCLMLGMTGKWRWLVLFFGSLAPFSLPAQTADSDDPGSLLLNPMRITLSGHFESGTEPTTLDLALRHIEQQIEQSRAADAAQSPLEPLWRNPIWKYLPSDPAGTLNSPAGALPENRGPLHFDNPFLAPAYLTLRSQHLESEVAQSEKQARWLFGR